MKLKRMLLADDHAIVRWGLRTILQPRPDLEIVAEAEDGKQAIELILKEQPDIAILDYSLPLIDGLGVIREVKARGSRVEIIIFTMHDNDGLADLCLGCGARAFLLKSESKQLLSAAIEAAAAHKPLTIGAVAERLVANRLHYNAGGVLPSLTPREHMVVRLISDGYSNKDMSRILNVSIKTVETHRNSIMRKLGAKSAAALVRYAIKNMFIEP
jgi:DNA-binding NarL/FixJ family response regulator